MGQAYETPRVGGSSLQSPDKAALSACPATGYDFPVDRQPLRVAVLGSTGSIGCQALDVIARYSERFTVQALSAGRNCDLLAKQVARFRPRFVSAEAESPVLRDAIESVGASTILLDHIADTGEIDILLVGTAGAAGLLPTIRALQQGLPVAIANKEVLVMAGHLVREAMLQGGGELRPVDSEHSAIWQCLWGEEGHEIRRIILTASGGAFRDFDDSQLDAVTGEQALNHPTWKMGAKITVDSATLMNKGMETIEAMWLFGVPMERVEVVVHRQSIVHSLVEFSDGSVKAQLGYPDMRLPIECALVHPERMPNPTTAPLDLAEVGSLTFERPDLSRFPCLQLAMEAGRTGGTMPAVMAAADEVAVERFLTGEVRFTAIPAIVEHAMRRHSTVADPTLPQVLEADAWARRTAKEVTV
jgi:1-deoxy-D-xylulose-5-phosphate reductoisomerase